MRRTLELRLPNTMWNNSHMVKKFLIIEVWAHSIANFGFLATISYGGPA